MNIASNTSTKTFASLAEWRVEAAAIIALAFPLALTQLSHIAMVTTDVVMMGWLGPKTLAACAENGSVYLHAIGGAAQVLAERILKVRNVYFLEEFGSPEAIWELEVDKFPAVVTMDSHGRSLHAEVAEASQSVLAENI